MSSRDDKKRPVYAPTVPYFIAVASGILADAWFAPGFLFWAILAIGAAAASCALFGRDWKRRRAAEKSTLTLKEAVCANDADFEDDGESFNVERADLEPRERAKAKENVEPETSFDADADAAAYWADWLAANGGASAKVENGKRDGGEESQDWNAALSRFLAERRRRGLSAVGAARFGDVEKEERTQKGNDGKARETETCGACSSGGRDVAAEMEETLIFDFEGFDEFSVWRGSSFQSGERSVDGTLDDRFDDGGEERSAQNRLNWRDWRDWRDWAAERRVVASRLGKRFGVWAFDRAREIPWRTVWAAVAVAALAGWRHDAHFNVFAEREIAFFVPADGGTPATLELKLTNTPQLYKRSETASPMFGGGESTVFEGRVRRAKNGGIWEEFDGRVSVSVDGDATFLRVGDSIRVSGKLTRPAKVGNPGEIDRRYILRSRRILTRLAVGSPDDVEVLTENEPFSTAIWAALALAAFGTLRSFGADLAAATGFGFGLDALGGLGVAALAGATDRIFDLFLGTLDALRAAPFGTFRTPGPPTWALWTFYLPLIFWTLFPKFRPTRRTAARALALWLAALLVADVVEERRIAARDATRIEIFSIGHGISILAFFPDGRTALFDCGSVSNSERAAEIAARALWNAGRTRIDLAVASHADYDHYGGLRTLAETVKIGRVCVSPAMFNKRDAELDALRGALERENIPIETVVGGETFARFGFPELAALHPTLENGPLGDESNANSLVVALERNGRRILLPGDLDAPGALFLRTPPTRFDLILAPHHGGKSENYRDLLDWADPTWVVVSGGSFQRNRATEEGLRAEGRDVLHTLDDGCVTVEIERDPTTPESAVGRMKISTFRSGKTFLSGGY